MSGWFMAALYAIFGIVCCLLIITFPLGMAAFRIAGYQLWPFGRSAVRHRSNKPGVLIGNILWMLIFGWLLAIYHLLFGIAFFVTIIGFRLGLVSFKMIPIALFPLGVQIIPSDDVRLQDMWV